MTGYARRPDQPRVLHSSIGTALTRSEVAETLRKLTTTLGLRTDTVHPVAHQLRHTFAVRTLVDWQRSGVPIDERIVLLSTYSRACQPGREHWYLDRDPGADGARSRPARPTVRSTLMSHLGPSLQAFFTDRLLTQRQASPNTIAAYRHTFQLLLRFATDRTGTPPSELDITQLDAPLIASFLDHLEHDRGDTIQTRNNRLAAIHSLFAAYLPCTTPSTPTRSGAVLAIPHKRTTKNLLTYLTDPRGERTLRHLRPKRPSTAAPVPARCSRSRSKPACGSSSWSRFTCQDITLNTGANVHTIGEEEKSQRNHRPRSDGSSPHRRGTRPATRRSAVPDQDRHTAQPRRDEHRLAHHLQTAAATCPSIAGKHITMHTLRHTAAMRLLLRWQRHHRDRPRLGHEQITTTQIYLHADMTHKQKAIDRTAVQRKPGRYRPSDTLLAFLEAL